VLIESYIFGMYCFLKIYLVGRLTMFVG